MPSRSGPRRLRDRIRALLGGAPHDPMASTAAYSAAIERAGSKLARVDAIPPFAPLTAEERAKIAGACERELSRFADRVSNASATDVGTPFFRQSRVLRPDSASPFPAQSAYAALPVHPGKMWGQVGGRLVPIG